MPKIKLAAIKQSSKKIYMSNKQPTKTKKKMDAENAMKPSLEAYTQEKINDLFNDELGGDYNEGNEDNITNIGSQKGASYKSEVQLTERYRPKTLDDIVQQDEIIKVLKKTLITGELPHLLFFGNPGTGKTSTIIALVNQLFGPKIVNDRVIELNASDERGIGTVRNKIISFTKVAIGSKDPNYLCPDYKVVILDEADAMTPEAQEALRKVMEKKCGITRFCFICNYIDEIIDPIASRCTQFRFKPLDKKSVVNKISTIAKIENINLTNECAETIHDISEGDLRSAIMILQNTKYLINYNNIITSEHIIKFTGGINEDFLVEFYDRLTNGPCKDMVSLTQTLQRYGYQVRFILNYIKSCVLKFDLNDIDKAKISLKMCSADMMLTEGGDEYLQLLNLLLFINMTFNSSKTC
jgi:replication factor C subunit 2/4